VIFTFVNIHIIQDRLPGDAEEGSLLAAIFGVLGIRTGNRFHFYPSLPGAISPTFSSFFEAGNHSTSKEVDGKVSITLQV
jgi:hypothetical protein